LEEIDPDGVYKTVLEYIESLDMSVKADSGHYQRRLAVCRACMNLSSGTCALCGCFVEVRAAILKQVCPSVPAKW
jgi:hypothetical protein